jgi:hypothetical protein
MLHKLIALDSFDIESNNQIEEPQKNCKKGCFIELLKPPTESTVARNIFGCNSLSVIYLAFNSKEKIGSTATGTLVTGNKILISMMYFLSVGTFVSSPKLYAYTLDSKMYSKEAEELIKSIQKKKSQLPLYCILWMTQVMSFTL